MKKRSLSPPETAPSESPTVEQSGSNMDQRRARRILAEASERARRRSSLDFRRLLFPEQQSLLDDVSRTKVAVCSRRAGKSYALSVLALDTAFKFESSLIPVISITRQQAKRIVWPVFQELDRTNELGLRFNASELSCTLPNGSQIFLTGASTEEEIQRLRGPKYPLVLIDEAQAFKSYLAELISDVLEPAVLDYDGSIVLAGTPNAICRGFFYEASQPESAWSVHHWTLLDNPHIPKAQEWLADRCRRYGWSESHPTYLREYKGQWIRDSNSLIYPKIPTVEELPPDADWEYVLGLDLGYIDSTAFVVCAYSTAVGRLVVVESFKKTKLLPSDVAQIVSDLNSQFRFETIVADAGGLGKAYVAEMTERWELRIKSAEKREKRAYIELLAGDMATGVASIVEGYNHALLDELHSLQWDDHRLAPHERCEDHLADAYLYAWRHCHQYWRDEILPPRPRMGSAEWWSEQEDQLEAEQQRQLDRDLNREWWDNETSTRTPWWERDQ